MKKRDNLSGFTIIEVALVLAIAGLIFLMVFVALPGLRASQRDAQRREDVISFLEKVKKYQSNNRGTLPGSTDTANVISATWSNSQASSNKETSWRGFYRDYLDENFMDPVGANYELRVMKCKSSADAACTGYNNELTKIDKLGFPNNYRMYVVLQATCNGSQAVGASNPRKIAVLYWLESAGIYCNNT